MSEKKETRRVEEMTDDVVEKLVPSDDQDVEQIPSGYENVDEQIGGYPKGEVTILAGRASQGKTVLAQNIARKASIHRKTPTVYFSPDSIYKVLTNILLAEAEIPPDKGRKNKLNASDKKAVEEEAERFENSTLFLDDRSIETLSRLLERIKKLSKNHDVELVVIDWLQVVQAEEDSRADEVAEIVRALKTVAEEEDIAILLLSEISDAVEERSSFRPRLIDVGETDVITQVADLVLLLYREFYYTGNENMNGITEVIVAKNSRGPCGSVELKYDDNTGRFTVHFDPKRYEKNLFEEA